MMNHRCVPDSADLGEKRIGTQVPAKHAGCAKLSVPGIRTHNDTAPAPCRLQAASCTHDHRTAGLLLLRSTRCCAASVNPQQAEGRHAQHDWIDVTVRHCPIT